MVRSHYGNRSVWTSFLSTYFSQFLPSSLVIPFDTYFFVAISVWCAFFCCLFRFSVFFLPCRSTTTVLFLRYNSHNFREFCRIFVGLFIWKLYVLCVYCMIPFGIWGIFVLGYCFLLFYFVLFAFLLSTAICSNLVLFIFHIGNTLFVYSLGLFSFLFSHQWYHAQLFMVVDNVL